MKKKILSMLLAVTLLAGGTVFTLGADKADASTRSNFGQICSMFTDYINKYLQNSCQSGGQNQKPDSGDQEGGQTQKPGTGDQDYNPGSGESDQQGSLNQSSKAAQVLSIVNSERSQAGLGNLSLDSQLNKLAQMKAEDMAENGYFSHTSPTYGSAFDMMNQYGFSYRTAGENIAKGQKTASSVMSAWMNSQGHRANILGSGYTKLGVGYAVDSGGTAYWVQMFAG